MGLLAKLHHFVPKQILLEIYLSPTQPYIKYGIAAWGQASKTHLNKILLLLKSSSENKLLGRRDHAITSLHSRQRFTLELSLLYQTVSNLHP